MIKVGLIGYGKAGQAVAEVLQQDARYELMWVAKRHALPVGQSQPLGVKRSANIRIYTHAQTHLRRNRTGGRRPEPR